MKPTLDKMNIGQGAVFPIIQWLCLRSLASKMKRYEGKQFSVNRRQSTVIVTRKL